MTFQKIGNLFMEEKKVLILWISVIGDLHELDNSKQKFFFVDRSLKSNAIFENWVT